MAKYPTTNSNPVPQKWSNLRFKRNIFQKQSISRLSVQYNKFKQFVKEKIQHKKSNLSFDISFSGFIPTEYSCPICLEILIYPASTACGHCFCYQCAQETFLHSTACPICRSEVIANSLCISNNLEQIIQKICKNRLLGQNLIHYNKRHEESKIWMEKRHVQIYQLQKDKEIDVKDTQSIWCRARIISVIRNQYDQITDVLVHYKGWDSLYDEVIEINSQRLAPQGFFTNRTDIPSYKMVNDQQQLLRRQVLRNRMITNELITQNITSQNNPSIQRIIPSFDNNESQQTINRIESQNESSDLPESIRNILQPRQQIIQQMERQVIQWLNSQSSFTISSQPNSFYIEQENQNSYEQQNSYFYTSEEQKQP